MESLEMRISLPEFGQTLSGSLAIALAAASDLGWTASTSGEPVSTVESGQQDLVYSFKFNGALSGSAQLILAKASVENLECRVSGQSDAPTQNDEAAFTQVVHQAKDRWVRGLEKFGQLTAEVEQSPSTERVAGVMLEIILTNKQKKTVSLYLACDTVLAARLQSSSADSFSYPVIAESSANLDLVLDVELNVTLRFGKRQLTLREVLDLNSGSVVELDRQVDEPIELVLDGRVVARGEAVIIDGNYGMRITQVVQPVLAN